MLNDQTFPAYRTTCDSLVAHGMLCVGVLVVAMLLWLLRVLSGGARPSKQGR